MKFLPPSPMKITKMKILRFGRDFKPDEEVILRDYLAIERTLLSYIRSSLYLILGGIAFLQLEGFANIKYLGILSLVLSVIFLFIGIYRFMLLKKSLKNLYYQMDVKDL
jgi:putative membrane protein